MIEITSVEGEGYEYHEPEKPQVFKEMWSKKRTEGLCYIQDIRHAISNSDQYPFPVNARVYDNMAAQDAMFKTLDAVIAAIDRVPVYEDRLDPDAISRSGLLEFIKEKLARYGAADYSPAEIIRDIEDFEIRRKEK